MKNLAIIPARSGSKGLPEKNIRPLAGRPLISYSIKEALASELFETVLVSTDSAEYAVIARECGAQVPFLRSPETSGDASSSWDAVREVLKRLEKRGQVYDTFALLQPTSPLRTSDDIRGAFDLMDDKGAKAVVSVCKADHSPLVYNVLPENGSLLDFRKVEVRGKRRQATVSDFYRINGAIYLSKMDYFLKSEDIYSSDCYAYIMSRANSVDIDDETDFDIAEALMTRKIITEPW